MCPPPFSGVFSCILEVSTSLEVRPKECPLPSFLPRSLYFGLPASLYPGLCADSVPLLINFIVLKCAKHLQET